MSEGNENNIYKQFLTKEIEENISEYIGYCKLLNPWITDDENQRRRHTAEFVYLTNSRARISAEDETKEYNSNISLSKQLSEAKAELRDIPVGFLEIIEEHKKRSVYIKRFRKQLDALDLCMSRYCTFITPDKYVEININDIFTPKLLLLLVTLKETLKADQLKLTNITIKDDTVFFCIKISGTEAMFNAGHFFKTIQFSSRRPIPQKPFKSERALAIPIMSLTGEEHD